MNSRQAIYLLLLSCFFASFLGCKSEQPITSKQLAKKLKVKDFDFDYLTIKSKLRFNDGGKDQKVAGYIRMKKDSVIWMSMSKASVEGVRIVVTQDSMMMLDRLKKEYYTFNYEQLQERFNFSFNFDMLQSVIIGNMYVQSEEFPQPVKQDAFFIVKELIDNIAVENHISRNNNKLAKVKVVDGNKNTLEIDYDDFQPVGDQQLSHHSKSVLTYAKDEATENIELELNYTKVTHADKPLKFSFRVSSKYKKGAL